MKGVIHQFNDLCKRADTAANHSFDSRYLEPFYLKVLQLVKHNHFYRDEFVNGFIGVLEKHTAPWEMVQFCMRELQWKEIKDYLSMAISNELSGNNDWRKVVVFEKILEVYEEKWKDADLYKYYDLRN